MNQIINMIMRILIRKGVNAGISKGADMLSRKKNVDPNSAEGKQVRADAQQSAKTAKQGMRVIKRMGRF